MLNNRVIFFLIALGFEAVYAAKVSPVHSKPAASSPLRSKTVQPAATASSKSSPSLDNQTKDGSKTVLNKHILQQTFKKLDLEIPIRVLLDEQTYPNDVHWKFGSQAGFVVFAPETKEKTVYQMTSITVTCKDGIFLINGKKQSAPHLFVIPLNGPVLFQKNIYDGVLALTLCQGTAFLVNHLDLEDYVLSVLPYESLPEWPDEVHRAFCIVFRSYGIAKVLEARAQHKKSGSQVPYDIKNTNAHQIYKGRSYSTRFKRIIDQTRGVVIADKNNKPALCMFDICCGGVVPSRKKGIHFSKAPYLKRTYPCNFCKDYKKYIWNCSYSFEDLGSALKKEIPQLGTLKDIKIVSFDDAGVVQEVRVRGSNQWYTLPASKFKSCLKDMLSLCFRIQKNGHTVKITGRGHGHHMGLCQRGAYAMVLKKWTYRNILKFYYPHTSFMKLQKMNY